MRYVFLSVLVLLCSLISGLSLVYIKPFENMQVTRSDDGSYEISYDLYPHHGFYPDYKDTLKTVVLRINDRKSNYFLHIPSWESLSGDIGDNVVVGTGKKIVWRPHEESFYNPEREYNFKLYDINSDMFKTRTKHAEKENGFINPNIPIDRYRKLPPVKRSRPSMKDFVEIPGGRVLINGRAYEAGSFYMCKYEVTQGEYEKLMGYNPAMDFGVGPKHPVYFVNWFDAAVFCNLKSINEGLEPCYYLAGFGTDPRKWPKYWESLSESANANVFCNLKANGYRLPDEAEWRCPASGSTESYVNYDKTITSMRQDRPEDEIYTFPVDSFEPNDFGLYNIGGNVTEWNGDYLGMIRRENFAGSPQHIDTAYLFETVSYPVTERLAHGGYWQISRRARPVYLAFWGVYCHETVDVIGFRLCRSKF